MIDITCPQCGKAFRVAEQFAGRTARCTACGAAIVIPALPGTTGPAGAGTAGAPSASAPSAAPPPPPPGSTPSLDRPIGSVPPTTAPPRTMAPPPPTIARPATGAVPPIPPPVVPPPVNPAPAQGLRLPPPPVVPAAGSTGTSSIPPYQPPPLPPPMPASQPTNGMGVAGFVCSLVGFFMCPPVALVGLILSLASIRREPKAFAIAGTVIGGTVTAIWLVVLLFYGFFFAACLTAGAANHRHAMGNIQTQQAFIQASGQIEQRRMQINGLPNDMEGNRIIHRFLDSQGRPIRYRVTAPDHYELRSAGPDGAFDTFDDDIESH